jgi:asparagine synthase (glutamine-hydrolysing)
MCGICGIFDRSGIPVDRDVLDKMTTILRHRGPDGEGRYIDREVGLGHRRLSIIDLEGGAQPIGNEDGTLQIVYNGEIYNFVELRKELEDAGHIFKTRSDTEVIVHAYEQWGKECVRHFNGMFAFALWDSIRRELFLARDHLGIKPLYYVDLGNRILFASEIKALLQDSGCPREVDVEALAELFTFRYVPSPKTLFKGIRKLPQGHGMTLSHRGIEWNGSGLGALPRERATRMN